MRDLKIDELEHVYGGGGGGKHFPPGKAKGHDKHRGKHSGKHGSKGSKGSRGKPSKSKSCK